MRTVVLAIAAVAVLAGPALAAEVPVPRPKPALSPAAAAIGAPSPEEAIARMLAPDLDLDLEQGKKLLTDRLTSALAPYAPTDDGSAGTPFDRLSRVSLEARLWEDGPTLGEGVTWRVFAEIPDEEGRLPLLRTASGGTTQLTLRPGRYLIHAAFGRAGTSRLLEVNRAAHGERFVLDAGGLRLDARIENADAPRHENLVFEIYAPGEAETEERRLIAEAKPGQILPLPAGPYHVVSRYGHTNAVRSADLIVSPGKLTSVVMQHRAAEVALKLVSAVGGEAIADTVWTVTDADGRELFDYVGAFPSLVLAEGRYTARVRHGEAVFVHEFDVAAGPDHEIEVLAEAAPPGVR